MNFNPRILIFYPSKLRSLILISALFFVSCSTIYIPNSQNVPLFEEKNQASIQTSFALGDQSSGLDIQGAVSVTNHVAVMTNAYFGKDFEDDPYNNFEVGAGYFTKLGDSRGIFEVYGGWGMGGSKGGFKELREYYENNHFFVQPNIGGRFGNVDLAFSTRINYVLWKEFSEVFFEPALTVRFGWEKVKFQVQMLGSMPVDGQRDGTPYSVDGVVIYSPSYETIHSSFGIYIPIDWN